MKKSKKNAELPVLKMHIKDFLFSEEGKISKKNIAKIGISLAVLGVMLQPQGVQAAHTSHSSHSNALYSTNQGGHLSTTNHASTHTNHSNHSNHGHHSSGSWC